MIKNRYTECLTFDIMILCRKQKITQIRIYVGTEFFVSSSNILLHKIITILIKI